MHIKHGIIKEKLQIEGIDESMWYEIFKQEPELYILILFVSLLVTLVAFGLFPLFFAYEAHKTITKKKYYKLCFGINFLVVILFIVLRGGIISFCPYVLWTSVFSAIGKKQLQKRNLFVDEVSSDNSEILTPDIETTEEISNENDNALDTEKNRMAEEKPQIKFCRKCGFELVDGSEYCSRCGTEVVKE